MQSTMTEFTAVSSSEVRSLQWDLRYSALPCNCLGISIINFLLRLLQVLCYEDNRLLKLFSAIVKLLYNGDIIAEDTIQHWYKKGSHPKGRNVFLKDMEPFLKWLEEAEEEDDEADE